MHARFFSLFYLFAFAASFVLCAPMWGGDHEPADLSNSSEQQEIAPPEPGTTRKKRKAYRPKDGFFQSPRNPQLTPDEARTVLQRTRVRLIIEEHKKLSGNSAPPVSLGHDGTLSGVTSEDQFGPGSGLGRHTAPAHNPDPLRTGHQTSTREAPAFSFDPSTIPPPPVISVHTANPIPVSRAPQPIDAHYAEQATPHVDVDIFSTSAGHSHSPPPPPSPNDSDDFISQFLGPGLPS